MNFVKYILENDLGSIETNYSFKELTTIGTGGRIRFLYSPNSVDSLCKAFKFINDNDLKYFILGNGSNILASDDFFDGIVINTKTLPTYLDIYEDYISVSASYPTTKLAYDLAKLELGDLSFLGGIPGLLGGAIFNNSGAYGSEIKDVIIDVTYINKAGKLVTIERKEIGFNYRDSIFHGYKCIIASARIKVNKIKTFDRLEERLKKRKQSQPHEYKNMGSIFRNTPLIESWKVIDFLNLRGFTINGAKISEKHTNFIINYNNAKSSDVLTLIELIKKRAKLELGINLKTEITII